MDFLHAAGGTGQRQIGIGCSETWTYMVNMMREHVPQETRIHYVDCSGGKAPNVVPDFAEVYQHVRHPKRDAR
ncbi:MAG: hypothetical protein IPO25_19830 [Saprospiraceae bacterium]|nr:hypothetical protein [Saprospiraceae bacterium]